jgi:hypothetical protein
VNASGDVEKNKWVVNFWSEAYAANFFGIWDRIPTMDDVIRFWNLAFPGGGAEMIEPVKLEGLCSEAEEWLIPDDVTMWDAFFAHFK